MTTTTTFANVAMYSITVNNLDIMPKNNTYLDTQDRITFVVVNEGKDVSSGCREGKRKTVQISVDWKVSQVEFNLKKQEILEQRLSKDE